MSQSAKVSSIDTLESFRANLVVYMAKANRVLDDVTDDISRTKVWLQTDRVMFWKREVRNRSKKLDQANAELMTERLADNREAIQARKIAVRKAKEKVAEAEERLARVKFWIRHYESSVESKTKVINQMRHFVDYDLKKALAYLDGTSKALIDYAEIKPVSGSAPPQKTGDEADASSEKSSDGGAS